MNRVVRIIGVVVVAVCALLGSLLLSGPTNAAPRCGAECPSVSVQSTVPTARGIHMTLAGRGFGAAHPILLTLRSTGSQLRAVRTNAAGAFETSVTVARSEASRDAVIATDARTGEVAQQPFQLDGSPGTATSGGYAGVALIGLAAIGAVLLTGSTLLLFAGRRRRAAA